VNTDIRTFYGFKQIPFSPELKPEQMYLLSSMVEISKKIQFAIQNSMYFTLIGDVGAGKSTTLRYVLQLMASLGLFTRTNQPSTMLRQIHEALDLIYNDGKRPVLVIDECHHFTGDFYAQLHLISQQNLAKANVIPIVMCGQEGLFEKLRNPQARPLMSRILDGYNLRSLTQDECFGYIEHHLKTIGGRGSEIFDKPALIAVSQALQHGMEQGLQTLSAEVIRKVTKNWWE